MVKIHSMKIKGLYSFREEEQIQFGKNTLILGPNNSGKTNIFRIIKLISTALINSSKIPKNIRYNRTDQNPYLEAKIEFSPDELETLGISLRFIMIQDQKIERKDTKNLVDSFQHLKNFLLRIDFPYTGYEQNDRVEIKCIEESTGLAFYLSDAYGLIISTKELLQKQLSISNHPNILHSLYGSEFDFSSLKIKDVVTKLNEVKNSYQLSNLREGPYKNPEDTQFVNKLYEKYKSRSSDLNFLKLIGSIIELKLSSLSDVRILKTLELHHTRTLADDASNLANYLSNIQNSKDREIKGMFTEIQNQFEDIFNKKISMDCYQDPIEEYTGERTERKIIPRLIFNKLNGLQLGIDEVGTGVIEVLTLLTKSRTEKNTMILMDEPALHLHPIQIRVTFEKILENISNSDSQAIFISHSTNLPLLSFIKNENEILYIKMKEAKTTVSQPDEDSKKWLVNVWDRLYFDLEPEVFYSKLVILVEGDSDYGFLKGLSQRLGKDLQINDIFISQINGKRNLPIFLKLLSAFDIPYLVLTDRDALIEISKDEYSAILLALKEKDPNILEELKKSFNISKISSTEREPRFVKRLKNDFKDKDAKIKKLITEIAKKYTNKTKEYSDNIKSLFEFAKKNNVFVIQEGDIEDLMETTDSALYEELRKKWKGNKRQTAREFAQKLDDKKLDKMAVLVEVLDASIDRVSN